MAHTEPPELFDRDGEKIVIFRRPDGEWFSNHPDYPLALAMHRQAEAAKEKAQAEADAAAVQVVDDEQVAGDNNDGVVEYEEMTSKDLLALAKARDLTIKAGSKRPDLIALLKADDEAKAAS